MTALITAKARAYVNHGRWVADCPVDCGSALALQPRQSAYHCPECKQLAKVEWPANADDIMAALERRMVPRTRNWFPAGHTLALRSGAPHGQSVKDLDDETAEHTGG
ncbi:hypothetical protein ACMA1D_10655 [Streptomyces sp. 796.1]|uniref:hypothetical protein n=1 Tax=Streptomyces sp. 796.1 TaxID=3163029 RepID=UPI0039C927FE